MELVDLAYLVWKSNVGITYSLNSCFFIAVYVSKNDLCTQYVGYFVVVVLFCCVFHFNCYPTQSFTQRGQIIRSGMTD